MPPFLHLWRADLAADLLTWPPAEATLSAAETARQARLRTPALRQTYGRAHGFLRQVLGQYVGQPAHELAFSHTSTGKPRLADNALSFNLSYRPGRAILAVSDAGAVGADVEPLTPLTEAATLINDLFSAPEQAALHAAAQASYWPLFYTIWTRKEAYAKALGRGVGMPFAAFSVLDFTPGQPPALSAPAGPMLHSFEAGPGYQGAVALLAPGAALVPQFFAYPAALARS